MIDLTINAVETASAFSPRANALNKAVVDFELPSRLEKWSLDLSGSIGSKTITASINEGGLQNIVDAINAATAETGTAATLNADGASITLQEDMKGDMEGDMEVDIVGVMEEDMDTNMMGNFEGDIKGGHG